MNPLMDAFFKDTSGFDTTIIADKMLSQDPTKRLAVLVVEDDLTSRQYLRLGLEKFGYNVILADALRNARQATQELGIQNLDCVVTDYRMPDATGLDVLAWVKQAAPWLSTIILTAESEKGLITDSLRGGAADFLEKPIQLAKLRDAISKSIETSHRNKYALEVESAVNDLARAQESLLQSQSSNKAFAVDICFHPKLEAGGDFFTHFQPSPGQLFCLLTDVSGHDLQAAYISAYFQGIVRGMLRGKSELNDIFAYFNQILVNEWNQSDGFGSSTSLAVCSMLFDFAKKDLTVLTFGTPAPVCILAGGKAQFLGESGGAPLGWFDELPTTALQHSFLEGECFYLWTDGLEDLAMRLGVTPLALGYYLQKMREEKQRPPELMGAGDDILFARVSLSPTLGGEGQFEPILFETYTGGDYECIDSLQSIWRSSLRLAFPRMESALEHDLLLACREIVLNAMQHGCKKDPSKQLTFQLAYNSLQKLVRIWCDDPGTGHDFNFIAHEQKVLEDMVGSHLGLILIKNLASDLKFERHGASVIIEFKISRYLEADAAAINPPNHSNN